MMKFEETFDFDYPQDTILTMFTDEKYFLDKYEQLGGRKPELVDSHQGEDHFEITVRHAMDSKQLSFPEIIRNRIGDRIMLKQRDAWTPSKKEGRIDIDIEKAPVEIGIDMKLTERGGKARLNLSFSIDADVPLLGSKIEKAISGPITKRMQKDLELSNRMAAEYQGG